MGTDRVKYGVNRPEKAAMSWIWILVVLAIALALVFWRPGKRRKRRKRG